MAGHVSGTTPVQLSIGQLTGAVVALLAAGIGAFWFVADFTSTGLRQDVSAIRATLATLQGSDRDNALSIKQAELDFTKQIGALNVTVALLGAKVEGLGAKLDALNVSLTEFGAKIDGLSAKLEAVDASARGLAGQIESVGRRVIQPGPVPESQPK